MKKTITILAVLFVLVLSSCRIGKPYQQPRIDLPQLFGNTSFADTSSIADIKWKNFFSDRELLTLIEKGLKQNHDLLIAIKRIDIAQQQLKQARLLHMPEVNAQVTAQYNRPSNNSLNGLSAKNFLGKSHVENYMAIATLSWEADIWGKIRAQKEVTLTQYLQTGEAVKTVQTQLVANIAHGYYNLLMLDKQLDIAKRNVSISDSFLTATRLLMDAGSVNALAVQQAESQRQSTAQLIPALEQEIALQENALQILTGSLPGKIARNATLQQITMPANLQPGLPVAMVSRRPDVRSAELLLMIANAKVGIEQANMYPALNITAGAGLESFKSSNWFNIPNSLFGLAAGSIVQPIFNRRQLKTNFEIAKIEREQAVIRFRQSVLQASGDVENALVRSEKLKEQQEIAVARTAILQLAVSNSQLLFKADMANYLEVLTAQSNALGAELNLAAIQRERLSAMVDLYRSLGGGWE